jgi:hypothetical protein
VRAELRNPSDFSEQKRPSPQPSPGVPGEGEYPRAANFPTDFFELPIEWFAAMIKKFSVFTLRILAVISFLLAIAWSVVWASRLLPRGYQIDVRKVVSLSKDHEIDISAGWNYLYIFSIRHNEEVVGPNANNLASVLAFLRPFGTVRFFGFAAIEKFTGPAIKTRPDGRVVVFANQNGLEIGMGYPILLFMILPTILWTRPTIRWIKNRFVKPPGFCRKCGYDLRATPERCPECGTLTPHEAPDVHPELPQ